MNSNKPHYWVYLLIAAGYAWLIWNYTTTAGVETVCLFKQSTGFACPSCGITRSIVAILEGNLADGFMQNPLGFVAIVALASIPLLGIASLMLARNLVSELVIWFEAGIRHPRIALPLAGLITSNWVWNILKDL
ncbi:MAG: DUF2752 domain-containing protein [Flavobacteriales bacterium]